MYTSRGSAGAPRSCAASAAERFSVAAWPCDSRLSGTCAELAKARLLPASCFVGDRSTRPFRSGWVREQRAPERSPAQAGAAGPAASQDHARLQAATGPIRKPPNGSRTVSRSGDAGGVLPGVLTFSAICSNSCSDCRSAAKVPQIGCLRLRDRGRATLGGSRVCVSRRRFRTGCTGRIPAFPAAMPAGPVLPVLRQAQEQRPAASQIRRIGRVERRCGTEGRVVTDRIQTSAREIAPGQAERLGDQRPDQCRLAGTRFSGRQGNCFHGDKAVCRRCDM